MCIAPCHDNKKKCSTGIPCANCVKTNRECTYPPNPSGTYQTGKRGPTRKALKRQEETLRYQQEQEQLEYERRLREQGMLRQQQSQQHQQEAPMTPVITSIHDPIVIDDTPPQSPIVIDDTPRDHTSPGRGEVLPLPSTLSAIGLHPLSPPMWFDPEPAETVYEAPPPAPMPSLFAVAPPSPLSPELHGPTIQSSVEPPSAHAEVEDTGVAWQKGPKDLEMDMAMALFDERELAELMFPLGTAGIGFSHPSPADDINMWLEEPAPPSPPSSETSKDGRLGAVDKADLAEWEIAFKNHGARM
jgi:hypothetical protein